ncbi:Bifunctional hemolysin/adenylate cyclase precursor [Pelagimonas phthalicica]|uniref:Bifunctional hemolysin/adenylate cyclase n=1 Tax=Pelagimonas phthalicica TaxID=1037362 RepID=A0A238JCH0_9RHOB|nr:Ig-like domain-containing protein [Pelagimonas phthalicica]TDS91026.1 Ca2+-binding RTX toxin-like protein [Pelagimonas phthalicica]SMX28073.1 Bifunctional hemolysin/adenylate cyclase precursor [Pelagimonas phthalicica]
MADLVLDWGALGVYGTALADTAPGDVTTTVDTGGVAVDISFDGQDAGAEAFTFNGEGYVAGDETFDPMSHLKLFGDGGDGGATPSATSTTVLDFRALNTELYTDNVQDVSFRLNDVDAGTGGDLGAAGVDFEDVVTINAYDADGNPVPVTMTPAGSASVSGSTVDGNTPSEFTDPTGSVLVNIAGPVSRIEIVYENGGESEQAVLISDVEFSTVDVTDENSDPDAVDDSDSTIMDTAVTIDALANDTDPESDPLSVTGNTDPANGTVVDNGDGTFTYTPDAGFTGTDTFEYTITDGNGGTDTATVTIDVTETGGNTDPLAADDADTTTVDTPVTIDVLGNDVDPESDPLTVTGTTDPANGSVVVNADGTVDYTPDSGFVGTDTFDYTISDGNGGTDTATVTVTVADDGGNLPPVADDDSATTTEDTGVRIYVRGNDTDPDGDDTALTITSVDDPTNGTATIDPVDGTIIYTPDPGFTGTETFDYTVTDPDGATDTATVTVTVTPDGDENDPPVAVDDTAVTEEGTPVTIDDPAANDSDPDGDPLTVTGVGTPTNGTATLNPDGTVTYTPVDGFTGDDTIPYTVDDGNGGTDTGEIVVTVTPEGDENEAPDAVDDTATTPEGTPVTIDDPSANDTDPDGDPLTVTEVGTPTNGTATLNPDGTVSYTPDDGFTGDDTIPYTVDDGNGGTDTGEIVVTVTPEDENEAPTAVDDTATTPEGTPVVIDDPAANDEDPDGDPLTVTSVGDPTNGTATLNPDGTVTYTPDDGFVGEDTIPYTVDDGNGGTDTGEIVVTVEPEEGRIDTDVFPVAPGLQPLDPLNGFDEDPDPMDDLDSIDGTSGADTIATGDDADTINAGGGDDSILPGIDDDLVNLGGGDDYVFDLQGADTILGGSGDDTILAGIDTFSDYPNDDPAFGPGTPLAGLGFDRDPNPDDGRDSIQGNLGNDSIVTGDDDDTIDGGGDNDTIDAGIDDDLVMGGQGDDSILGGHGSDTLDGGQGNDFIDGSAPASLEIDDETDPNSENDRDSIDGALGDDTLLGGDDDDTLIGGSGEDLLDGGIDEDLLMGGGDDDTLLGGDGNDTLNGGDGDDSIRGGADRDMIQVDSAPAGIGDTVDGGAEGDDHDILDLGGVGERDVDWRIADGATPDSNGNGLDGTIEFLDGAGNVTGTMEFFEIEEIVCFTPGTLIATPSGERLVEDLQEGDRVITRDNGIQEIKWLGRKDLTGHDLARKPHFKPILIQKGALGNNLPEHDLLVSPNHRVLVANDKTALYFEEREVLVAAKHLTGLDGVDEVESLGVSYIHIMFENHEVILSNGAWTESFQPGDYSLKGIGNAQRQEIFELFPELEHAEGLKAYGSARRSLKKHEAALLTK